MVKNISCPTPFIQPLATDEEAGSEVGDGQGVSVSVHLALHYFHDKHRPVRSLSRMEKR